MGQSSSVRRPQTSTEAERSLQRVHRLESFTTETKASRLDPSLTSGLEGLSTFPGGNFLTPIHPRSRSLHRKTIRRNHLTHFMAFMVGGGVCSGGWAASQHQQLWAAFPTLRRASFSALRFCQSSESFPAVSERDPGEDVGFSNRLWSACQNDQDEDLRLSVRSLCGTF